MRENTDQKKLRIWILFTQCNDKDMHAAMHVTPNPDIQVYIDASLTGGGIGSEVKGSVV